MTEPETTNQPKAMKSTIRCGFCLTANRVDVARGAQRPQCGSCGRPILLDRPIKVAEEDFSATVLEAEAPVLVDFYADWCGPCKMLAPMMDEIAANNVGALLVAKVDTDTAQSVAAEYKIRGVPTVILFRDGKEVDRSVGIEPERLRTMVESA